MTARSKFVFQTPSPVREQSVQNVVLVPQNPLEQIVVQIFKPSYVLIKRSERRAVCRRMKWTCAVLAVLVVATAVLMAAAERDHEGTGGLSEHEANYGALRYYGPEDTIVNLPGGEQARYQYQMDKIHQRHMEKDGVNQLRRRRRAAAAAAAARRTLFNPVDRDDANL